MASHITTSATSPILDKTFERVSHPYRDRHTPGSDENIPLSDVRAGRAVTKAFKATSGATHDGRSFVETDTPVGGPMDFRVYSHYARAA
ncbi:hypothetical protein ACRAKI_14480 [Saccharothrix isguenensis]